MVTIICCEVAPQNSQGWLVGPNHEGGDGKTFNGRFIPRVRYLAPTIIIVAVTRNVYDAVRFERCALDLGSSQNQSRH